MASSFLDATSTRAADGAATSRLETALSSEIVKLMLGDDCASAIRSSARLQAAPSSATEITALLEADDERRWAIGCYLSDVREENGANVEALVYGEFPIDAFHRLVDAACEGLETRECTFCDLGSGAGRLVVAAAMRRSWRRCVGIEALPELHALALARNTLAAAAAAATHGLGSSGALALAPCSMRWLEVTSENALDALGSVDVLFAFSTCFDSANLAAVLAAGLRPSARVVTIDCPLVPEEELTGAKRAAAHKTGCGGACFRLLQRQDDIDIGCEVSEDVDFCARSTAYIWQRL